MRIHREGTLIIEIRKAEKADVPAILDLVRGKAEFDGCLNSLQSTEADIEEAFFSEQPKAFALLAMKSGEAVGIATYYSIYSTFIAKPGIWLDDLFVYPQFRGSGVGEALLSELCILARIFEEVRRARLDECAINALAEKAHNKAMHPTSG